MFVQGMSVARPAGRRRTPSDAVTSEAESEPQPTETLPTVTNGAETRVAAEGPIVVPATTVTLATVAVPLPVTLM